MQGGGEYEIKEMRNKFCFTESCLFCFSAWGCENDGFWRLTASLLTIPISLSLSGRLELWPIRSEPDQYAHQANTHLAGSAALSASLGRAWSSHVEPHRLSASPAVTVSNGTNSLEGQKSRVVVVGGAVLHDCPVLVQSSWCKREWKAKSRIASGLHTMRPRPHHFPQFRICMWCARPDDLLVSKKQTIPSPPKKTKTLVLYSYKLSARLTEFGQDTSSNSGLNCGL